MSEKFPLDRRVLTNPDDLRHEFQLMLEHVEYEADKDGDVTLEQLLREVDAVIGQQH